MVGLAFLPHTCYALLTAVSLVRHCCKGMAFTRLEHSEARGESFPFFGFELLSSVVSLGRRPNSQRYSRAQVRFRASEVWWLGPWAAFFNVVEAPKPTPSGRAEGQLPASTGLPAGPLGLLGLSEGLSYLVAPRPKTTQTESARSSPQNTERGIGPPCSHGCSRTTSRPGVAGRSASHPCRVNESDALIAGASCLCSEARPGFLELR